MINISEIALKTIEDTLIAGLPAQEGAISEPIPNFTNFIPGSYRQCTHHPKPRCYLTDGKQEGACHGCKNIILMQFCAVNSSYQFARVSC